MKNIKVNKTVWTERFPKKPGLYWFYGFPFGQFTSHVKPDLNLISVHKTHNGILATRNGSYWLDSSKRIGLFTKVNVPDFPDWNKFIPDFK
jgi:hypothetical protein